MSVLRTAEIPSAFGALDSTIFADGQSASAMGLRTTARNSNRLLCAGEPVLTLAWEAAAGADEATGIGQLKGYGFPFWTQITAGPIRVPKKPGLTSMEVNVTALITSTNNCEFAMTTSLDDGRLNSSAQLQGYISMTGDGSSDYQHFAATGVPCSPEDFESLTFYMRGTPTTTLAAAGTNSGGLSNEPQPDGTVEDSGSAFSTTLPMAHVMRFENAAGELVAPPARVIIARRSAEELVLFPGFSASDINTLSSASVVVGYKIYQLPVWRICCINVNTEDRTT